MLVLTRKPGERLMIGENVAVTVKEIRGGKCKLFIEAPRDVPVWRYELWVEMHPENDGRERTAAG